METWPEARFDMATGKLRAGVGYSCGSAIEPVGDETRVQVEHYGWDRIPPGHIARHQFPDALFFAPARGVVATVVILVRLYVLLHLGFSGS